ncbi:deaminase domain-containing protein, partial [Glaesserella parasuis]|nr:deaminase domain-containing protein [Glaesserella parasuis]
LIAHALLGAVEAAATGNNVLAGAAAGAGSEAAADFIVKTLYKGKSTQDLTEAEKQNVTLLSQLASGLASGLIGDSTQSAAVGADIGKRAVENNYLLVDYSQLKGLTKTDTEQGQRINEKLEKAGVENIDDYATQYRACGDNSSCQRQVIDAEMEAISRSYDIINELAKSGELSKNDIDFIQSTLVPRARGAYDSKTKDEATRVVYRSGDLETFAKSEQRLAEARFSAQLKSWVDQGLTDEQIRHKLENEPLAIALSTAGPNVGGRQPSGSGMGVPTFANARQTLLQIRALSKQASDFSVEVPSTVSAKDRQVTVTETVGYGKGTTNLRVSTGAENVALYPKLKDDLRSQQQAGFEKVIKDLNVKPQGSVLMLPDYRQKLAEAKSSLPPNLQGRGNSAIAQINIEGLDTTILAGNSRINKPIGSFVGQGKTEFTSLRLPNKEGKFIDRRTDSEYKIFSNLADQLGSNTQAKGQVIIFTERPACPSCLGVSEQFNKRYPNIKVNIFDNNGNLIKP